MLEQFSKTEIIGHATALNEVRLFAKETVSSLVIKNEDGTFDKSKCHQFIVTEIIDKVCDYFGVVFSASQKVEVAKEMYAHGYFIKDAEWKLFLSRCKSLYYANEIEIKGQMYVSILMQWFNLFVSEVVELTYIEAEQRHQKNIQDNLVGAKDRGFETVAAMVDAFDKTAQKESTIKKALELEMRKEKKDLESVRAEQQQKMMESLSEKEKVEFTNAKKETVKRIFDTGEIVKYAIYENNFVDAIFLEYTHLFNIKCSVQLTNGIVVKDASIYDVAKIIKI